VTCTNGELGDAPGGIKPGEPEFSEDLVVATRLAELEESCRILKVAHLERLGFRDSGMVGWDSNHAPGAFASLPVEQAASPLITLIEEYRPHVLVTYDERGIYGHPDHIQAHRITLFAARATGIADKLYFPAISRSAARRLAAAMAASGMQLPEAIDGQEFGVPDELVTTDIDCTAHVGQKRAALQAHRSQTESTFFMTLPAARFDEVFAHETFIRHFDRTGARVPETDLFAGIRPT